MPIANDLKVEDILSQKLVFATPILMAASGMKWACSQSMNVSRTTTTETKSVRFLQPDITGMKTSSARNIMWLRPKPIFIEAIKTRSFGLRRAAVASVFPMTQDS
jgi:hypothetical protein